jgi:hypothetical protein
LGREGKRARGVCAFPYEGKRLPVPRPFSFSSPYRQGKPMSLPARLGWPLANPYRQGMNAPRKMAVAITADQHLWTGDLLPPLERGASPFGEGDRLLQGLQFGAVHPYGPMGARARASMSQRVPPRFGGGHRQAGPRPGLQLTRPHGGRLSERVFVIVRSDVTCPPSANVGGPCIPPLKWGALRLPHTPLFCKEL